MKSGLSNPEMVPSVARPVAATLAERGATRAMDRRWSVPPSGGRPGAFAGTHSAAEWREEGAGAPDRVGRGRYAHARPARRRIMTAINRSRAAGPIIGLARPGNMLSLRL